MQMWTRDGAVQAGEMTAKEMLTSHPPGAYTTARTVDGGTAVFQLGFHLERLATSMRLMREKDDPAAAARVDPAEVAARVTALVAQGLRDYRDARSGDGEAGVDVRFTALLVWGDGAAYAAAAAPAPAAGAKVDAGTAGAASASDYSVLLHFDRLPPLPSPPIVVEVRGHARANALAKDSGWVSERRGIEAARAEGTNEVLLEDDNGRIVEGSQSNFFAVIGGAVHTAGEGVLMGSVRDVVLRVCEDMGVSVVLEAPRTDSYPSWDGAFITSTSRLVLPIDKIVLPLADPPAERTFPDAPGGKPSPARAIADAVARRVSAESTPV